MSEKVENLRNIALVSHSGAGKTSLSEAMLYDSGTIKRFGRVEEGNTAMDFEPEELKRTSSISSGFHQVEWKKHTINMIDTPGDQNFFSDTLSCQQAADGALVVIDAIDGIKVQTEQAWEFAKNFQQPCMILSINSIANELTFPVPLKKPPKFLIPNQLYCSSPSVPKRILKALSI